MKKKKILIVIMIILFVIGILYYINSADTLIKRSNFKTNQTGAGTQEEPWDISANDGTSNVQAILSEDGKHLTIRGTGAMKDWSNSDLPVWYENKDTIEAISIDDTVTNIGDCAFYEFTKLGWVTIPRNIKSIGYKSLERCTKLNDLVIMPGVEEIKMRAFANCTSLGTISIPNSVLTIGEEAFEGCINLVEISVEQGNNYFSDENGVLFNAIKTKLVKYPPKRSVAVYEIPDTVEEIGQSSFAGCNELIKVIISDTVTNICANAFFKCTSLESIEIPSSVTNIGTSAFGYCSNMSNINISGSEDGTSELKIIDSGAFFECTSLNDIVMPKSLKTIGGRAFANCETLTSIEIKGSKEGTSQLKEIKESAFANCKAITNIIIPEGINIEKNAFYGAVLTIRTLYNSGNFDIKVPLLKNQNFTQYNCVNCELTADKETVKVFSDEITYTKPARLNINDGNLWGLEIIIYAGIDVSLEQSHSVIATLESDTLVISGTGAMKNYKSYDSESQAPWTEYRTKIKKIRIKDGVTSIGTYAFVGLNSLIDIELPEGIIITNGAFDDATLNLDWIMDQREGTMSYEFMEVPDILQRLGDLEDIATFEFLDYNYMPFDGGRDLSNVACELSNFSPVANIIINEGNLKGFKVKYNICWNISAEGEENEVIAQLLDDRKTLAIYGHGNMKDAQGSVIVEGTRMPWLITKDNKNITKVIIEGGVNNIGVSAFAECEKLEEVSIPNTINSIKTCAFSVCSSLENIYLPASVLEICSDAFIGCSSLTNITVADENEKYSSNDGILFNKDKTTLIKYPEGKTETEYEIPSSVTTLKEGAFISCTNLTDVIILKSVVNIEGNAFDLYNENLTIHGYKGSEAETYARENNIKFNAIRILEKLRWGINDKVLTDEINSVNIKVGESTDKIKLYGIYSDESKEDLTINWGIYSNNEEIAKIENGILTGISIGKTELLPVEGVISVPIELPGKMIVNVIGIKQVVVKTVPEKTTYIIGESETIDLSGGEFTIVYTDETTEDIPMTKEGVAIQSHIKIETGEQVIILEYKGHKVSFKVNVIAEINVDLGRYTGVVENEINYIQNVPLNTKVKDLINEISTNATIEQVFSSNNSIVNENSNLATGMEFRVALGNKTLIYKIVVTGDVTGDGIADISDLVLLARYVAKTDKNVETIKLKAMQVTNNDCKNIVDMSDLVIMARYVSKKINSF